MSDLSDTKIENLWERLINWYSDEGVKKGVVAYSGGKDSTLVLISAKEALENMKAVIIDAEVYPDREIKEGVLVVKKLNVDYEKVEASKIEDNNFKSNPEDRCYYCKLHLFKIYLVEFLQDYNFFVLMWVTIG